MPSLKPLPAQQVGVVDTNMDSEEYSKYLEYPKKWDEKVNSTLPKIEKCILFLYGDDIKRLQEEKNP